MTAPGVDLISADDVHSQLIFRVSRLADGKENRVVVQVQTKVPLTTFLTVVRHHHSGEEAALYVVTELSAAAVSRGTKITALMLVSQLLAVTFVVSEAMEAKFETNRQLLTGHLEGQIERLQMRHALRNAVDDQVIPLHVRWQPKRSIKAALYRC